MEEENKIISADENKSMSLEEIADKIAQTPDVRDTDLINLFNAELAKRNIVRISKYDQILDMITDEMYNRLLNPDDDTRFGNGMLLEYLDTIQKLANNASEAKQIDANAIPKIQYNTVNVNVVESEALDRESKQRVLDAIKSILQDKN